MQSISRFLADNGVVNRCEPTLARGHLEKLVAEAADAGHERIIVAGGDGTVHEAVNGILGSGARTALGVIPVGSGNDFADAAAIPSDWRHAAALLADRIESGAAPVAIDAGRCNARYFANGAGIGFDAAVTAIAAGIRLPAGDLVYAVALLSALKRGVTTSDLEVRIGKAIARGPVTLLSFSNGPRVGGMFRIAPAARHDDGLLDMVRAEPLSRLRVITLLPKLLRGLHLAEPEVTHCTLRHCTVDASVPVEAQLDGELQSPQRHFEIDCLPGALRLI